MTRIDGSDSVAETLPEIVTSAGVQPALGKMQG